jgi:hypothetical protein
MADVAGTIVPVVADARDLNFFKAHGSIILPAKRLFSTVVRNSEGVLRSGHRPWRSADSGCENHSL